jgi:hypothetical protein
MIQYKLGALTHERQNIITFQAILTKLKGVASLAAPSFHDLMTISSFWID